MGVFTIQVEAKVDFETEIEAASFEEALKIARKRMEGSNYDVLSWPVMDSRDLKLVSIISQDEDYTISDSTQQELLLEVNKDYCCANCESHKD